MHVCSVCESHYKTQRALRVHVSRTHSSSGSVHGSLWTTETERERQHLDSGKKAKFAKPANEDDQLRVLMKWNADIRQSSSRIQANKEDTDDLYRTMTSGLVQRLEDRFVFTSNPPLEEVVEFLRVDLREGMWGGLLSATGEKSAMRERMRVVDPVQCMLGHHLEDIIDGGEKVGERVVPDYMIDVPLLEQMEAALQVPAVHRMLQQFKQQYANTPPFGHIRTWRDGAGVKQLPHVQAHPDAHCLRLYMDEATLGINALTGALNKKIGFGLWSFADIPPHMAAEQGLIFLGFAVWGKDMGLPEDPNAEPTDVQLSRGYGAYEIFTGTLGVDGQAVTSMGRQITEGAYGVQMNTVAGLVTERTFPLFHIGDCPATALFNGTPGSVSSTPWMDRMLKGPTQSRRLVSAGERLWLTCAVEGGECSYTRLTPVDEEENWMAVEAGTVKPQSVGLRPKSRRAWDGLVLPGGQPFLTVYQNFHEEMHQGKDGVYRQQLYLFYNWVAQVPHPENKKKKLGSLGLNSMLQDFNYHASEMITSIPPIGAERLKGSPNNQLTLQCSAGACAILMRNVIPMFWDFVHTYGVQHSPEWKAMCMLSEISFILSAKVARIANLVLCEKMIVGFHQLFREAYGEGFAKPKHLMFCSLPWVIWMWGPTWALSGMPFEAHHLVSKRMSAVGSMQNLLHSLPIRHAYWAAIQLDKMDEKMHRCLLPTAALQLTPITLTAGSARWRSFLLALPAEVMPVAGKVADLQVEECDAVHYHGRRFDINTFAFIELQKDKQRDPIVVQILKFYRLAPSAPLAAGKHPDESWVMFGKRLPVGTVQPTDWKGLFFIPSDATFSRGCEEYVCCMSSSATSAQSLNDVPCPRLDQTWLIQHQ